MQLPKSLVEGYRRFLRDRHLPEKGHYLQLAELVHAPTAMVIACCDARLDVSAIFDAEPGALFIMRNVANLVPPYEQPGGRYHGTSAAIEYAAMALRVPHIIVLGHSRCVGVRAYREQIRDTAEEQGFIEFKPGGQGEFHFGYVHGYTDCRETTRDGQPAVEWSWEGNDEMDPAQGRGWAVVKGDELHGMIFFHGGDDSEFVAKRAEAPKSVKGNCRLKE